MNNIELHLHDTTDLDAERCKECGGIDFESTDTRTFCIRCGLVSGKSFYSLTSTELR